MRRAVTGTAFAWLLIAAAPAPAAEVDRTGFRHLRQLNSTGPRGPIVLEPDGPLFAHSQPGFADLRILDSRGRQVAWRRLPQARGAESQRVGVLNSGRQGRNAVALLDLGEPRRVRDRVDLEIPDRAFIGRAVVLGADRRSGPFTRLSATGIYDVRGAAPARSTVAVFSPSDFRYLLIRASGVSPITGATVSGRAERPPLIQRRPRGVSRREEASRTVITLDLGFRNFPVDELRISAETAVYERQVTILGSNPRRRFGVLAGARIFRFAGSRSVPIAVPAQHRYLRIEIENGDDPPLRGIEVSAWARSRALLVEGGGAPPFTIYYGNPDESPPSYDFARLPVGALGLDGLVRGQLGPARSNPAYEPPADTRSFVARHPGLVAAALALAALALGAAGLLALRKRA